MIIQLLVSLTCALVLYNASVANSLTQSAQATSPSTHHAFQNSFMCLNDNATIEKRKATNHIKENQITSLRMNYGNADDVKTIQSENNDIKDELLQILSTTPTNSPSSKKQTEAILGLARRLERICPTRDQDVVSKIGGNWELVWTAQDPSSPESRKLPFLTWINPLENQAYSNNPDGNMLPGQGGRSNPVLPRPIQDRLESLGIISTSTELEAVRSIQSVDLKKREVRNVVTFTIPSLSGGSNSKQQKQQRASIVVSIDFWPNKEDDRKIDVKFQACRFVIAKTSIDFTIPLGFIGPLGWLRTAYIDDSIRITRGHKGSVFILSRAGTSSNN